jgi:hypothetical protein
LLCFKKKKKKSGLQTTTMAEFYNTVILTIRKINIFVWFYHNPAIPDSDETVRILAFISNSGYISRNQVKMVRIFSVNDRISLSMIFILFYINIYMFWIKINFYRLIWLNENMKNICDFLYVPNTEKCFRRKIFSKKMTSLKPFYDENHFTSK